MTPPLHGPPRPLYCDSSALLKLYVPEPGSDEFNRVVQGRADLIVSDLAVSEIVSALARRQREGALTPEDARRVHRVLIEGIASGVYENAELTRDVHRRAEHFLLTLKETPLRAADAMHQALATAARAASLASFGGRLGAAARAVGLATYP